VVPAVVQQAAVDPRRVACRLLAAAVVRLLLAAAVRLEGLISAPAFEEPAVPAKALATADRRRAACRRLAATIVRPIPVAADRLWFLEESFSAPALEAPAAWAKA